MGFWNGRIWELLDCRYNGKTTKCGGHRSWKVWAPAHNYCVSNPLTSSGLSFFLSKMGVIMWIHASASWGTEKVHLKTLKARVCVWGGGIVVQANLTRWGLCSETDILPSGGSDRLRHATHTSKGKPREYPPCCPRLCHLTSWNTRDYWCSIAKSCLTLCNPVDCSMPGFLCFTMSRSLLKLLSIELAIPSNHLILSPPSPFAFTLSQHWVFSWVGKIPAILCG